MAVSIYFQDVRRPYFASNHLIYTWLDKLAAHHGYSIADLNIIFVTDEELLAMNRQFLQHDYYTDIITFDLGTSERLLMGELYISLDRVKDNARQFNQKYQLEFVRVIAHGLLHLIGYQDKKKLKKNQMTVLEDQYLSLYLTNNQGKKVTKKAK